MATIPSAHRRLPRWSELGPLLRPKPIELHGDRRRAAAAASVHDLRAIAQRRVPKAVFDYVDGGAESELSLRAARSVLEGARFAPRTLRDVSQPDPSTEILGMRSPIPVVFAPTGFTRMMHSSGELAVARAAGSAGITYALSTMGTTSLEDIAAEIPGCRRWFQLYIWRDRARSLDLIQRAEAAGYDALILTVDTAVPGARLRDVRNGMTIPPAIGLRTVVDGARHPHWWFDLLTTPPLSFASLAQWQGTVAELAAALFDPTISLDDLAWLRDQWAGKLIVKGITSLQDATDCVDVGVDAVVISNHGGRQLDRSPTPLDVLPRFVEALGDQTEIMVDGGFMSGSDVVVALCLGATAVLVGRAYLYGLMAAGEAGVRRTSELLATETVRTMQLLGAPTIKDLSPELVRGLGDPREELR